MILFSWCVCAYPRKLLILEICKHLDEDCAKTQVS